MFISLNPLNYVRMMSNDYMGTGIYYLMSQFYLLRGWIKVVFKTPV